MSDNMEYNERSQKVTHHSLILRNSRRWEILDIYESGKGYKALSKNV